MLKGYQKPPPWGALWLVLCVVLNAAGWILSACHQLNVKGYATFLGIAFVGFILWWRRQPADILGLSNSLNKLPRHFKRGFPIAFLILAGLAALGGLLYAPNNYDALAYRLPRILNWMAEEQWVWVHTSFQRLNTRGCGYEWLATPLMVFTHSDRLLFLINIVSFLLLPGLLFSVMTRMGIRARAAWYWMWLLPSGYCYLLQAGGIGNDLFSTVFALAALDFAFRARTSGKISNVWLAICSVALLTGGKSSNIPLTMPALFVLLFSLPLLRGRVMTTMMVIIATIPASYVPMAALNAKYCGDWSGQAAERSTFMKGSPIVRFSHNILLTSVQNLTPPIFPFATQWNETMLKIMSAKWKGQVEGSFEPAGAHLEMDEMQIEEAAGIGFGVTLLLVATFFGTWFAKACIARPPRQTLIQLLVQLLTLASVFPFLWVSGLTGISRLLSPYYVMVVPIFFRRQTVAWTRLNRWWKPAAFIVFLMAAMLVIISPSRPLWPAQTILAKAGKGKMVQRARAVYSVYAQRATAFRPAVESLPPDTKVLALIATDAPEASLWKPFGARKVEYLTTADDAAYLRQKGIKYILLNPHDYAAQFNEPLDQWLAARNAEIVKTVPMTLRVGAGSLDWLLAKVRQ